MRAIIAATMCVLLAGCSSPSQDPATTKPASAEPSVLPSGLASAVGEVGAPLDVSYGATQSRVTLVKIERSKDAEDDLLLVTVKVEAVKGAAFVSVGNLAVKLDGDTTHVYYMRLYSDGSEFPKTQVAQGSSKEFLYQFNPFAFVPNTVGGFIAWSPRGVKVDDFEQAPHRWRFT